MIKKIGLGIIIVALILLATLTIGIFSSLQAGSQQQTSSKTSSLVEMNQGNGTYWIFYGGNIYQSDNVSSLLNGAQQYFQGTIPP